MRETKKEIKEKLDAAIDIMIKHNVCFKEEGMECMLQNKEQNYSKCKECWNRYLKANGSDGKKVNFPWPLLHSWDGKY